MSPLDLRACAVHDCEVPNHKDCRELTTAEAILQVACEIREWRIAHLTELQGQRSRCGCATKQDLDEWGKKLMGKAEDIAKELSEIRAFTGRLDTAIDGTARDIKKVADQLAAALASGGISDELVADVTASKDLLKTRVERLEALDAERPDTLPDPVPEPPIENT